MVAMGNGVAKEGQLAVFLSMLFVIQAFCFNFEKPKTCRRRCLVATGDGAGKDGQLAVFLSVAGEPADTWREKVEFRIRMINQNAPTRSIERGAPKI